jgi:hypothetical protein
LRNFNLLSWLGLKHPTGLKGELRKIMIPHG